MYKSNFLLLTTNILKLLAKFLRTLLNGFICSAPWLLSRLIDDEEEA